MFAEWYFRSRIPKNPIMARMSTPAKFRSFCTGSLHSKARHQSITATRQSRFAFSVQRFQPPSLRYAEFVVIVMPYSVNSSSQPFNLIRNLKGCFQSILKLLNWTWQSFKTGICEMPSLPITTDHLSSSPSCTALRAALLDLRRLLYISNACLRLLRIYVNEIYPKCGKCCQFLSRNS